MKVLQVILLILIGCLPCPAGEAPGDNVPPIAEHELERRGNAVRETGSGIRATEEDAVIEALAPPANDNDKWYFTLVTQPDCPPCERLKYDLLHAKELQAWVNVSSPKESQVHYQARSVSDVTQAGWLATLKDRLDVGGFPALVIQPPRSGTYGDPKTVVALIHGYDGNPKRLVGLLSDKVATYVKTLHRKGLISKKDSQPEAAQGIGATPPFVVDDKKNDPYVPSGPHDWPPPQMLTLSQIQAAVPKADSDFILQTLAAQELAQQPFTIEDVQQAWKEESNLTPEEPVSPKPVPEIDLNFQPARPTLSRSVIVMLIALGLTVASLIGCGLYLYPGRKPQLKSEPVKTKQPAKKRSIKGALTAQPDRIR